MKLFRPVRDSYLLLTQYKKQAILLALCQMVLMFLLMYCSELPYYILGEPLPSSPIPWVISVLVFLLDYIVSPILVAFPLMNTVYSPVQTAPANHFRQGLKIALYYALIGVICRLYQFVSSWLLTQVQNEHGLVMLLGPIILVSGVFYLFFQISCRCFGLYYLISGEKILPALGISFQTFLKHPLRNLLRFCLIGFISYLPVFFISVLTWSPEIPPPNIYAEMSAIPFEGFGYLLFILSLYSVWKEEWQG